VALNADTRGLLGAAFFDAMKSGAFFINTSRGEVVDEDALAAAIRAKGLRAGLDVYAGEPAAGSGEFVTALAALPGVYGTHHIGASTDQAQEAIAAEAVRIVKVYAATGIVPNVVNLAKKTPATSSVVVRHLDRPGVLAHALDAISSAGINVQEMENIVFDGAEAAVARIHVEGVVEESLLTAIKAHEAVIDVSVIAL
jgi:D-3-phosphoglycerate dehydrogenase